MPWLKAIPEQELAEGSKRVVTVGERSVLLVKQAGEVLASDSKCPHMGGPLEKGTLSEDGSIVCPWHRSAFDLRTGDVKSWSPWPPAVGRILGSISRQKALRVYRTRIEDGYIWVLLDE